MAGGGGGGAGGVVTSDTIGVLVVYRSHRRVMRHLSSACGAFLFPEMAAFAFRDQDLVPDLGCRYCSKGDDDLDRFN